MYVIKKSLSSVVVLTIFLLTTSAFAMKRPLDETDEREVKQVKSIVVKTSVEEDISLSPEQWDMIIVHCDFPSRLQLSHTCTTLMDLVKFDLDCEDIFTHHERMSDLQREKKQRSYAVLFALLAERNAINSCIVCFHSLLNHTEELKADRLLPLLAKNNIKSLKINTGFSVSEDPLENSIDITAPFCDFLLNNSSLKSLDAAGTSLCQGKILTALAQHSSIKYLKLQCEPGNLEGGHELAEHFFNLLMDNKTLLELKLRNSWLNLNCGFEMLEDNSTLQKLIMKGGELSDSPSPYPRYKDTSIKVLCNALKNNTALRKLDLSRHNFTDAFLTRAKKALKDRYIPLEIILEDNLFSTSGTLLINDGMIRIVYSGRTYDLGSQSEEDSWQ